MDEAMADKVASMAVTDASQAIDYARQGDSDPIVWITGNSYMPPLRAFGQAETVWQMDDHDMWEVYFKTFVAELDKANVYLGCPDYDNALYVVDLDRWQYRWQYVNDGDEWAKTLQEEWEPITS